MAVTSKAGSLLLSDDRCPGWGTMSAQSGRLPHSCGHGLEVVNLGPIGYPAGPFLMIRSFWAIWIWGMSQEMAGTSLATPLAGPAPGVPEPRLRLYTAGTLRSSPWKWSRSPDRESAR